MYQVRHPIRNFTSFVQKHNALNKRNIPKLLLLYGKLILQEPFRWREYHHYSRQQLLNKPLANDPIFILGHWRSGTSLLQYLLSEDPQFGYLTKFQAMFPDIFLKNEQTIKPIFNYLSQNTKLKKQVKQVSVNIDWDSPSELDLAMTALMSPVSPHWGHIFPQQSNEYFNKFFFFENISTAEKKQWQDAFRLLISKIYQKTGARQVIIKSPGNTGRIRQLLELYPNAKFIYIHRNPLHVFYSNQKIWKLVLNGIGLQSLSQEAINQKILLLYQKLLKTYLQQRSEIPAKNLVEIQFETFIKNPIPELERVYDTLRLSQFLTARPYFEAFIKKTVHHKPRYYEKKTKLLNQIQKHWQFSLKEWPYPGTFEQVFSTSGKTTSNTNIC